jgi:hypothetical protein
MAVSNQHWLSPVAVAIAGLSHGDSSPRMQARARRVATVTWSDERPRILQDVWLNLCRQHTDTSPVLQEAKHDDETTARLVPGLPRKRTRQPLDINNAACMSC